MYFKDIPKGKKIIRPKAFKKLSGIEKHTDKSIKGLKDESLLIGYPLMDQSHPDAPAMQILTSILSGNSKYSYFENNLNIENDTVIKHIKASADFWENAGTLSINVTVTNKNSETYVLDQVDKQLELLINTPVNPIVLQQVKKQFEMAYVDYFYHAETFADKVTNYYHTYKKTSDIRTLLDDFNKVTADDIQRVAKKYFDKENRILIAYHPE